MFKMKIPILTAINSPVTNEWKTAKNHEMYYYLSGMFTLATCCIVCYFGVIWAIFRCYRIPYQGRNFDLKSGSTNSEGERGALRSQCAWERGGWGGSISFLIRLWGLGTLGAQEFISSQRDPGGAPDKNGFIVIFKSPQIASVDSRCKFSTSSSWKVGYGRLP